MKQLAVSPRGAVGMGPSGSSGHVQSAFGLHLYDSTSANTYVAEHSP